MKKIFFTFLLFFCCFTIFGQAKKPTILVIPSDNWMQQNGYMSRRNVQGVVQYEADYRRALIENSDIKKALVKVNSVLKSRGFIPKILDDVLKEIEINSAEDPTLQGEKGDNVSSSLYDEVRAVAGADIIVKLSYEVKSEGPKKYLDCVLEGVDAYLSGQIASSQGVGSPSFQQDITILIQEAILANIDTFCADLQSYFDNIFKYGRLIKFRITRWETWEHNLVSEQFGGKGEELRTVIENWVFENTVDGKYNLRKTSANLMIFDEVRIPMFTDYNGRQKAIDALNWVTGLQNYLKKMGIVSSLTSKGLGEAFLVLGSKSK